MTTHEYIKEKFGSFGIQVSNADLFDIHPSDEILTDTRDINVSIVKFIPQLLARPNISENGFSISWDRKAIMEYYNLMCKRYGLKNELIAKVTFL